MELEMDPVLNTSIKTISIAKPLLGKEEENAVAQCIRDNWISQGPRVIEFETLVAKSCNKKYASACNSGTTALHLALHLLDLKKDDEVIIPNMTMIAVANAVLDVGATPVFCDSGYDNGNVSLETIQKVITNKTKAVILVHTYGELVKDVQNICGTLRAYPYNIKVIEDCAEAHFATDLNLLPAGSFGDIATFSFYSNKNITTGEGGAVCVNSLKLKERLDRVRMHAFTPGRHFWHTEHAYGYRMTEMQAAIGIEQFKKAPLFMQIRRSRQRILRSVINSNPELFNCELSYGSDCSGAWVMPILTKNRANMRKKLALNGIETRSFFQPLSEQCFLKQYARPNNDLSKSIELSNNGFYLPIYPALTDSEFVYILESVIYL